MRLLTAQLANGQPRMLPTIYPSPHTISTTRGPLFLVFRGLSKTMAGPFKGLEFHHLHFFPSTPKCQPPTSIRFCCSVISFHLPFFFFFLAAPIILIFDLIIFFNISLWLHAFVIEVLGSRIHSLIKCPLKMNGKLQGIGGEKKKHRYCS